MTVSSTRSRRIDYAPCKYNGSRLWFRGPMRSLRSPYVACLGGSSIYGRYLEVPWSVSLHEAQSRAVVNLAVENAGLDAYLNDPGTLSTAAKAEIAFVQITGSHNTSNRYYSVHPRRNDRFLKASSALRRLYPEMDFTEVHFTGHLLNRLEHISADRFEEVRREIRAAWRARMRHLIGQMDGKIALVWFAPVALSEAGQMPCAEERFLRRSDLESVEPHITGLLECVPKDWRAGFADADVPPLDSKGTEHLPGPEAHRELSQRLADYLEQTRDEKTAHPKARRL